MMGETHEGQDESEIALTGPTSPLLPLGNGSDSGSITQSKKVFQGVGFGDMFKEGSVKLRTRASSSETEEKKTRKALNSVVTGIQNPERGGDKPDTDGESKAKEYYRALFAYEGTNEDELTFKEGEIIHLISKDPGETGWRKGETMAKKECFQTTRLF
ncbi:hypothetical protein U0070_008792 [Myodes glareolus]|uniref:SH3 domain-containing protein n=1 Tax=Myodes glareolus TaxID=447135 RepID=A0AAW0GW08_MYOGA